MIFNHFDRVLTKVGILLLNFKQVSERRPDVVSVRDFLIKNKDFCFIFHPSGNPLSWISFSLEQFRLLCFAQAGSMFSLPGFHPSGNPPLGLLAVQKFLHSVLICFANPTPPNFFTGRRSLISFGQPSQNLLLDYWRSQGLVFRFEFLF